MAIDIAGGSVVFLTYAAVVGALLALAGLILGSLRLAGRDVYVREGCYNCHSQMVRPFVSESLRYGPPSEAGESVYDRPFQWGVGGA